MTTSSHFHATIATHFFFKGSFFTACPSFGSTVTRRIFITGMALTVACALAAWVLPSGPSASAFAGGLVVCPLLTIAAWLLYARTQSALPDEDHIHWQLETFEWLFELFSDYGAPASGAIYTPTEEDFPVGNTEGTMRARRIFELTREHAGMGNAFCRLAVSDHGSKIVDIPGLATQHFRGAAGTFSRGPEDIPIITYDTTQLDDPEALIATFAHELSHLLMDTAWRPAPGGASMEEPPTDVCAVYLGFDIFLANTAFKFQTDSMQWSARWQGYLSQDSLATALAILVLTLAFPPDEIIQCLTTNPRVYFQQALQHLPRAHAIELERLRFLHHRTELPKDLRRLFVVPRNSGELN